MDPNLLRRYFDDRCTLDERRMVSQWLSDPVNEGKVMELMEGYWEEHMAAQQPSIVPISSKVKRRRLNSPMAIAAAIVAVLITALLVIFTYYQAPIVRESTMVNNRDLSNGKTQSSESIVSVTGISGISSESSTQTHTENPQFESLEESQSLSQTVQLSKTQKGFDVPQKIDTSRILMVKSSVLKQAKLVNEQAFLKLLSSLDSTSLTHLFSYRKSRMQEILSDIQQKYNLEIEVCDERINRMIVSKDIDAVNIRELLFQIRKEMDLTYSVHNNRILICFNDSKTD